MPRSNSFRVGKVTGYPRGRVWYLYYLEHGPRPPPRAGPDRDAARQPADRLHDPIELLTPDQERALLGACDDWQFPVFLTLLLTGLRPGELCHLLLPDDLDLNAGVIRVRNKPRLGRQVKTRNQWDVPLVHTLVDV